MNLGTALGLGGGGRGAGASQQGAEGAMAPDPGTLEPLGRLQMKREHVSRLGRGQAAPTHG